MPLFSDPLFLLLLLLLLHNWVNGDLSGEGENSERAENNYFYWFTLISVPLQKESVGGSDGFG